jgi:flagellar motility protein MotE (MotC chaperone)
VLLVKKGALPDEAGDGVETAADAAGDAEAPTQAGLGAPPGRAGGGAPGGEEAAAGAAREKALASGQALFDVPQPISIAEASALMNELKSQKRSNEERKSALDQRERELDAMNADLEARRLQVLELTQRLQTSNPPAAVDATRSELDPGTISKLAQFFGSMQPQASAKALERYPPERAARILLAMADGETNAGDILSLFDPEKLEKITDAIGRVMADSKE